MCLSILIRKPHFHFKTKSIFSDAFHLMHKFKFKSTSTNFLSHMAIDGYAIHNTSVLGKCLSVVMRIHRQEKRTTVFFDAKKRRTYDPQTHMNPAYSFESRDESSAPQGTEKL